MYHTMHFIAFHEFLIGFVYFLRVIRVSNKYLSIVEELVIN